MENNNSNLQSIQELPSTMPKPSQNVIGWSVKSEADVYLGKVIDLIYDTQAMTVRYLILDLTDNGMELKGKNVMIPVGMASLHVKEDEVILPNLHIDQFNGLPNYQDGEINTAIENEIREVIGSPAALRMEETIAEIDQENFYAHQHFNSDRFYNRQANQTPNQAARSEEKETIHELIDNSLKHDLHAAADETGKNTHHNEGR